jgi:heat shock protein HslJ
MKRITIFTFFFLTLSSCQKETFTRPTTTLSHAEILGKWEMIRYQDLDVNDDRLKPNDSALGSMVVEFKQDSTVTGRENCNDIQGNFLITNQKIKIFNIGKTKVGCTDAWVKLFYNVFDQNQTTYISKSGDILTLISENTFKKVTLKKI